MILQDVTHKIVEAISTIAGSSLEQTTWLRRNLEVKPSPQIMVDGANLEADVEGQWLCISVYVRHIPCTSTHVSMHIGMSVWRVSH